jgi:hypothetical protein
MEENYRVPKRSPRRGLESFHAQRQKVQDVLEEKLGASGCQISAVEVQWKNIKKRVLDIALIWLGKSRGKEKSHGLHKKLSGKWTKGGNGRMSTTKKE